MLWLQSRAERVVLDFPFISVCCSIMSKYINHAIWPVYRQYIIPDLEGDRGESNSWWLHDCFSLVSCNHSSTVLLCFLLHKYFPQKVSMSVCHLVFFIAKAACRYMAWWLSSVSPSMRYYGSVPLHSVQYISKSRFMFVFRFYLHTYFFYYQMKTCKSLFTCTRHWLAVLYECFSFLGKSKTADFLTLTIWP